MSTERVFVGREAELRQFKEVLEDPQGQAILVIGQAGMGKTWLLNKMVELAEVHPALRCGAIRYEVTPTDNVDGVMAMMMDHAFDAGQTRDRSFDDTSHGLEQWRSLLNIFGLGDLIMSLRRDPVKNTREQFLERLKLISKRMPGNGRALFVIDPEKYMQVDSDQSWAGVVKDLPAKIKLAFAQRPGDVLLDSETFDVLRNVVRIPRGGLAPLEDRAIDDLLTLRAGDTGYSSYNLAQIFARYDGYPYAVGAALDLLAAGTKLEELPSRSEPTRFAELQWKKVCEGGEDAIKVMEAYAILEVGVPDDVVEGVSGLSSPKRKSIFVSGFMRSLLRQEGCGKRIYHSILADYVVCQMMENEREAWHLKVVDLYRRRLRASLKPDPLAAVRLPEHILISSGTSAFVHAFVNECARALMDLGNFDTALCLSLRALAKVRRSSMEEAVLLSNLGLIHYSKQGNLAEAERMHLRALEIDARLGRLEGIGTEYGNLGLVYLSRGSLDSAERMFKASLEIEKRLSRADGIARAYGNLGLVYRRKQQLDRAQEMCIASLAISEKCGLADIMASQYGNLGLIFMDKGDLERAMGMFARGLEIERQIGRVEGEAAECANLGTLCAGQGRLDRARFYWAEAERLFANAGMTHMVQEVNRQIHGL